ncbi:hypothetical protein O1611_g8904 [Lasiodiplodia mahajangana]|uniref:Uncharacterized protein n=1 Tax=Lasiodiplodia mahajangana TaxID=1108764 RepID=A0ACC2JBB6_9PEZI|nr:hypothetical protein O1611_g8904 [Lasiodiplodia mahajangana]
MEDQAELLATRAAARATTPAFPARGYQYRSVSPEEWQSDFRDPHIFKMPTSNLDKVSLPWRPFYLRWIVLFAFIAIFLLIIAAIEILLLVSNKNSGIATGNAAQHYLWTYGPTAFLTAIAAFWARTEYQSKLVAPWIRLSQQGIPASRTLLQDYVSPLSVVTFINSCRNGDHVVSITFVVSTIIKVLILLSSGLISLSLTSVSGGSYLMVLQDAFVDSNTKLTTTGNLPSFLIHGLASQNLTLPEGISSQYAYQSVSTNLPTTVETRVTVDGLINSLDCEAVDLRLSGAAPPSHYDPRGVNTLNVTISSPNCNIALTRLLGVSKPTSANSTLFARWNQVQCDNIAGDAGRRVLVLFGNITYHTDYAHKINYISGGPRYDTVGVLDRSSQFLCVPKYTIERVEVTRNGTQTKSVLPIQGSPQRNLSSVTPWAMMDAQFVGAQSGFLQGQDGGSPINVSMVPVEVDLYMELALGLQDAQASGFQATSLFDPAVLQQVATGYYQQMGAILAKQSLMEPTAEPIVGSASVNENRLIVRSWIAQLMVGLLAACILFTTIALFLVPRQGFLPNSPSTLLNVVSILQHSRDLVAQLCCAGASDDEHLTRFLKPTTFQSRLRYDSVSNQSQYYVEGIANEEDQKPDMVPQTSSKIIHPIILHPPSRLTLCLGVLSLIIALELLLYKSNLEDGFGDVGSALYIHYSWTVIPALVFGSLSMAFSSVDFEVRNLAPYMAMKRYISRDKFAQLDLLDMTPPKAIYRETKLGTPWASATTTAFLIASLFTTFSASLFQELSVPIATSITLMANQSFLVSYDNAFDASSSDQVTSLILEGNYSFPRFTYQDLAFPELVPAEAMRFAPNLNASTVSISAVLPAIRATMDCRLYESNQIHTNLTLNHKDVVGTSRNPFWAQVKGEACNIDDDEPHVSTIDVPPNVTYYAEVTGSADHLTTCSDLVFFWAKFDFSASPIVQHTSALGCNTSYEVVDVNTKFLGTDLDLDLRSPPQPLEGTARNSTLSATEYR